MAAKKESDAVKVEAESQSVQNLLDVIAEHGDTMSATDRALYDGLLVKARALAFHFGEDNSK